MSPVVHGRLVLREVRRAGLELLVDRLRGEPPGLDRVVDPLQLGHVDHAAGVAADDHAGVRQARERPVAALRDRLRAPGDALAALEDLLDERVELELLQHVVDRDPRVGVVEPAHEPDRDLRLLALAVHAVDPRAAELLVLGLRAQRPAERVDDLLQRLLDLPDLLDAERPDLRVVARQAEPLLRGAGQVAPAALGEHGRLGHHVRAGLEVALLAAVLVAALVARADADDLVVLDQQLVAGGLREDVGAGLLGLLGQPAVELGDRDDVVAVVAERRRDRPQADRALLVEHEVHGLALDLAVVRPGVVVREQLAGSTSGSSRRPRAGARRRPCPSRSPRPGPRRASRSAPGRPRAAAAAGSRTPGPPGRRRRWRRRPRSARPRRRSAGR